MTIALRVLCKKLWVKRFEYENEQPSERDRIAYYRLEQIWLGFLAKLNAKILKLDKLK